jgi:hypothetical protein
VSGQRHARGKAPLVPIVQEAGWTPELVWPQTRGKILLPLPGIESQSPGRPVRSQTLYLLSYPAAVLMYTYSIMNLIMFRDLRCLLMGSSEHGGEFLEDLSDCQFPKMVSGS